MSEQEQSTAVAAAPAKPRPQRREKPRNIPRYHVVLINDDDHTYEYVIAMLGRLFGHAKERAFQLASEVDNAGRAIVDTTTKERAEFKQEQIHAFGPDRLIPQCRGSMTAVLEPCPE